MLPELKGKAQHHILEVSYDVLDARKQALLSGIAAFRSPMSYDAVTVLNPYRRRKPFDSALDEALSYASGGELEPAAVASTYEKVEG